MTNSKNSFELIAFCEGTVSTQDVLYFYVNLSCEEANFNKFDFFKSRVWLFFGRYELSVWIFFSNFASRFWPYFWKV